MPDTTSAYDWKGRTLKDRDGDKIGKIDALYLDNQTDRPEWALVNTGMFGSQSSFVPLAGAFAQGDDVIARVDASQVKDAPTMDPAEELSEDQEVDLFRHYGVENTTDGSGTATGNGHTTGSRGDVGHDTSGPHTLRALAGASRQPLDDNATGGAGR